LISELPGFGFREAIFRLCVFTRTKVSLLNLRGRPSHLQMQKIYDVKELYICKEEGFPLKLSRDTFVLVKTQSLKMA
jgi:sulfur relay (sulfurtransferase) DsrF/TusC family protein